MADDELSSTEREPQGKLPEGEDRTSGGVVEYAGREGRAAKLGGFLSIYKPGQGYWTRMGTVAGAALMAALMAQFLYERLKVWLPAAPDGSPRVGVIIGVIAGFIAVFGAVAFWVMNKPTVVDFLIATESEMKKVNWTTRKDLIGSTKVVILFMFLIAAILFVVDMGFSVLFWSIGVLRVLPFGK